ncbi:DUF1015 domain-containing protein [Oscillospiraceae bacterium CM]|nr:DUF1015 domain-containing protein [Oscillospiraceae bacterium CM]
MRKSAFFPADILLPVRADLETWSVVACDQFSSERDYWERVQTTVGNRPSTLHLIVPEVYLDTVDLTQSAGQIGGTMATYLKNGIFKTVENAFIYVERTISDGRVRRGLVGMLDLEAYDYIPGSRALVRASEKTITARLPARIAVRRAAALEVPHIMALIDDRQARVIEPLADKTGDYELLYDFTLMEGGGAIKGWRVPPVDATHISEALSALTDGDGAQMIIGDGNHSLASAKGYWDEMKTGLPESARENHPARYALVEVNNVYDPAITFEAIHRIVFDIDTDRLLDEMARQLPFDDGGYAVDWITGDGRGRIAIRAGCVAELIELLQTFLDQFVEKTGGTIDYIHGESSLTTLASEAGNIGFLLPTMDKSDFFKTVLTGGVFPKKSFSIGHARDKRYYLDCRAIRPGL